MHLFVTGWRGRALGKHPYRTKLPTPAEDFYLRRELSREVKPKAWAYKLTFHSMVTGRELWKFPSGPQLGPGLQPHEIMDKHIVDVVFDDNIVFLHTMSFKHCDQNAPFCEPQSSLYAINFASGKFLWNQTVPSQILALHVDNGRVWAFDNRNALYAFNAQTGAFDHRPQETAIKGYKQDSTANQPMFFEPGRLILPVQSQGFYVFDTSSTYLRLQQILLDRDETTTEYTSVRYGDMIYWIDASTEHASNLPRAASVQGSYRTYRLHGLRLSDGTPTLRSDPVRVAIVPRQRSSIAWPPIVVHGNHIYTCLPDHYLHAFSLDDGRHLWARHTGPCDALAILSYQEDGPLTRHALAVVREAFDATRKEFYKEVLLLGETREILSRKIRVRGRLTHPRVDPIAVWVGQTPTMVDEKGHFDVEVETLDDIRVVVHDGDLNDGDSTYIDLLDNQDTYDVVLNCCEQDDYIDEITTP